jgi:hypothetical protein
MTEIHTPLFSNAMPSAWSDPAFVEPSEAQRSFQAASRRHGFGFLSLPDFSEKGKWRRVSAESGVETDTALSLLWQEGVVCIREQVGSVRYARANDPDGAEHYSGRHYFDFVAETSDGLRIAFLVRPRNLQDTAFNQIFEALTVSAATGEYCDEMRVISRDDFYPSACANAAFAINCLAHGDAAADELIKPHLPVSNTVCSVRSVVEAAKVGRARGLRSIARYILCGFVQHFEDDELQLSSTLLGVQ